MARQQLFTETTLTVMLPVLHHTRPMASVLRFWLVVFAANVVGTFLFAAAMTVPHLLKPETMHAFTELGVKAVEPGFLGVLVRAVVAGWLIALMVWLLPAAESARILVIVAVTWLIAVGEFSHVIAGSAEAGLPAMQGQIAWSDYWLGFLLPALIGNSIGGVVFVALLNHAQVREEI
jgi:formate/nitrite transporter FocA (FNT family)